VFLFILKELVEIRSKYNFRFCFVVVTTHVNTKRERQAYGEGEEERGLKKNVQLLVYLFINNALNDKNVETQHFFAHL